MTRNDVEQEIIRCDALIKWDRDLFCESHRVLDDFIFAWNQLARYYREQDDREISVEIIRVFREATHLLYVMTHNMKIKEECRDMAKESLETLEILMTDITEAVDSRLYPDGR
jgi:hypothetical protein